MMKKFWNGLSFGWKVTLSIAAGILAAAMLSLVQEARAEQFQACWQNATLRADDSVYDNPKWTHVKYGACDEGDALIPPTAVGVRVDMTYPADEVSCANFVIDAPGRWCVAATNTDTLNQESELSNSIAVTVHEPVVDPRPPGELRVTDRRVYEVLAQPDRFFVLSVGTIPVDTLCDRDQPILEYNTVSAELVDWNPGIPPRDAVVAKCY
jgi:hypothetical protein